VLSRREILGRACCVLFLAVFIWACYRQSCHGQCTHDQNCYRRCQERNDCPAAKERP
jgi:hypothetical protein